MGFKIEAGTKNIRELSDKFYIVPDYQREYVWQSDKHVQKFLDDINDEFDPLKFEEIQYFIGSIIIVKRSDSDNIFDVIDGQQRLTTIMLCLCSIRDIISSMKTHSENDKRAKEGVYGQIENILSDYSIEENFNRPRLELQYEDSKDFLNEIILKKKLSEEHPTDSIRRMREAFITIDQYYRSLSDNNSSEFLSFARFFISKIQLVVIAPNTLGSALKIFETINERGVGLNAMDLLKNLLFASASKSNFEVIKSEWKTMISSIEDAGESGKPLRFLRYFLMAKYYDGVIREDSLYNWISSTDGKRKVEYENYPVEFAKELKKYAEKYRYYIKATESKERDKDYPFMTGIGHLLRKNSRQHLVLLMALNTNFDNDAVNMLAKALETLSFYYAVNRVLTKTYERQFALWASEIRHFKTKKEIEDFTNNKLQKEIDIQRRKLNSSFNTRSRGDIQPQYRIKFILGEIDNYIRRKSNLSENSIGYYQGMEIEHILPQSPVNMPTDFFEDEYIYSTWTERMGNITLLESPINQSLGKANDLSSQEWFQKKKSGYKQSGIELTRTILANRRIGQNSRYNQFVENNLQCFDTWGTSEIEKRQEMQKNLMLEIWKI